MKRTLLLTGIIISIIILAACSSEQKEAETENVAAELEEIKKEYDELEQENKELKRENKELKKKIKTDKNKTQKENKNKEYGLDKWWKVDDQWRLKIDSVEFTDERNEFSDKNPEEVVVIKYTYENLGYEGDIQDLFLKPSQVVDGEKKVAERYPAGADVSAQPTPVGATTEGAEESYGLTSSDGDIKIMFEEYDNNSNKQKATFSVPLPDK